jgi:hypothetical protein
VSFFRVSRWTAADASRAERLFSASVPFDVGSCFQALIRVHFLQILEPTTVDDAAAAVRSPAQSCCISNRTPRSGHSDFAWMAVKMTMSLHFGPCHGRASGHRVNECCFHRKLTRKNSRNPASAIRGSCECPKGNPKAS